MAAMGAPEVKSIDELGERLRLYMDPASINQVRRAYLYAEQAHDGQKRRSGEPYVTHPLAVAGILAEMHMDAQSLMAAMLHDVIEDTEVEKNAIVAQFGEPVAELVDGVSKLTQIEFASKAEAQAENFQKMVLAMAEDIRVILVKLSDRLHNMRTLGVLRPDKRRRIARETLEIYAPIAAKLGMHNLRVEFEELGFRAMHPMRADRIESAVKAVRGNRHALLENIRLQIEERLQKEGLVAMVSGREKHLYSIYRKMSKKSFKDIMDVFAFRIVTNSVDSCYRALGMVHGLYKPVAGMFKDYIAIPKSNGYQSLHTVLFGMYGVPIEIQIRTHEMDVIASNGIAAHWLYKSDKQAAHLTGQAKAQQWIKGLLDMQAKARDSIEFIENVKIDLFPDDIYIFSPKGKIFELPAGANAIDFAYAVHTDVGNACVGCRIDRQLSPVSTPLQSGQTVEIITAPGSQPNPNWLDFVITAKARTAIRHFLKNRESNEAVNLGKRLLAKAVSNLGKDLSELPATAMAELLADMKISEEQLLQEIGIGKRVAYLTARRLVAQPDESSVAQGSDSPLAITGAEGLVLNYGNCCRPLPGDPIVGFISAGRGMVVHLATCGNVAEHLHNPDKCVPLAWSDEVKGDFQSEIRIDYQNERGLLAKMAARLNDAGINIEKIRTEEVDASFGAIYLLISVKSRIHLARVVKTLRKIDAVLKVTRVKHY
ncbi:MAG: guanosine-3,5-bis(diphosphate) 3-pyrophosphohydrolase [Pseudomonadota bacterium]